MLFILSLHQTTTKRGDMKNTYGCYLFYHYIKPQLGRDVPVESLVVIYSITTSNHNWR